MTDRGGRTRARDADRDQVVALLEAAFVDGQLDRADYDQRVGQALAAKTLGELEPLTHDLQSDEVDVTAEPPRFGRRAALAAGLGLVLLGGAGWRLAHRDDEEEPAAVDPPPTPAAAADVSRPSPSPSPSPTPAPVDLFTVTGMRTLLAAIHSRFGTTAVYELTVRREHPDRADMTVPYGAVRKDRLQSFGWTQPDGFDDGDSPRTNTFGDRRFDLDRLDLARFRKMRGWHHRISTSRTPRRSSPRSSSGAPTTNRWCGSTSATTCRSRRPSPRRSAEAESAWMPSSQECTDLVSGVTTVRQSTSRGNGEAR